ncbi:unnamed protein product [Sphenostylis stenocarpa]|uniref:Auxin-induced protein n=1 Tax=Sphenostylis stenocarpa TaxID=92480 RepID=A0AA86SQU6_9FABA|nr:unnamed protein product [Sphenostylis stenocarpa]
MNGVITNPEKGSSVHMLLPPKGGWVGVSHVCPPTGGTCSFKAANTATTILKFIDIILRLSSQGKMESRVVFETHLNLKATELRLGLPGTQENEDKTAHSYAVVRNNKRPERETSEDSVSISKASLDQQHVHAVAAPQLKAEIVGWPPIRSYRKNSVQEGEGDGIYVKVSMDGAPYLRKIDLKVYRGYPELLKALETMFKLTIGEYSEREGYKGSEYAPTYEDKDGDWMLVGDVPWDMFMTCCKRLRIMKGSEARGLGCGV